MRFTQVFCEKEKIEYPGTDGLLILGDGLKPPAYLKEKVQCVYLDPPFRTGNSFSMHMKVGADGWTKGFPTIDLATYQDRFKTRAEYQEMLKAMILAARDLLKESGAFFLHLDCREAPYARILCDEIFGENNFVNEIIWSYQTGGRTLKRFSSKHDTILFYQKSRDLYFNIRAVPVSRQESRSNHMKRRTDEKGRVYRTIQSGGKLYTYYDDDPVYPGDVWADVSHLQQKDPQRTGYDTQKPVALLNRIIMSTTRPGDTFADLCCGSGTSLVAALSGGRKFLGMDITPHAIAVSRKRLTDCALTIQWPFDGKNVSMTAQVDTTIGYYNVTLTNYACAENGQASFTWQDTVDQWSVGFLINREFHTYNYFCRSRRTPEFQPMLNIPMFSGALAVSIIDIWGNRSVWVAEQET